METTITNWIAAFALLINIYIIAKQNKSTARLFNSIDTYFHKLDKHNILLYDIFKESFRPYVQVALKTIDYWMEVEIKNIGKRPAHNLTIRFEGVERYKSFVNKRLSTIKVVSQFAEELNIVREFKLYPPEHTKSLPLYPTPALRESKEQDRWDRIEKDVNFIARVSYQYHIGKEVLQIEETFTLDLSGYSSGAYKATYETGKALNDINKNLEKLNTIFKK